MGLLRVGPKVNVAPCILGTGCGGRREAGETPTPRSTAVPTLEPPIAPATKASRGPVLTAKDTVVCSLNRVAG